MTTRETSRTIDAAAADWVARMDRAPLTPDEQAQFDAWIGTDDARRLGAFARASAVMAHADRARALSGGAERAVGVQGRLDRRRLMLGSAIAAGAAGVAFLGYQRFAAPMSVATIKGEIRRVPLPDGSSATLNTASKLRIHYDKGKRFLELLDGEALFDVAKDHTRPFIVMAGATEVRAVGTSFTVRRLESGLIKVLVREGVVEIRDHPSAGAVRLAANAVATAPSKAPTDRDANVRIETAAVAPAEVCRGLAWRDGLLAFDGVPLKTAADEFARYSDTRIVIDDARLSRETITGLFSANDPVGFANAAATSLGGRVSTSADEIHLAR